MPEKIIKKENISKNRVLTSVFWSYAALIMSQGGSFVVSIILGRILEPSDYGIIAIVTVFLAIMDVFVVGGLGSSLVQKKDADELDYSTVCWMGVLLALVLYAMIWLCAPILSGFYKIPLLVPVIRVMAVRVIVAAINSVQHAYISKHLVFKKFFFSTFTSVVLSAVVGIVLAYAGFGVWSLVVQTLVYTVVDVIVLFIVIPWRPKFLFSVERGRRLFSFGWKIVLTDLIQTLYNNLRNLTIGKKYTTADLAYYNRGHQMTNIVVSNVDTALSKVMFPVLAGKQDDVSAIQGMTRIAIKISSFVICPMIVGLCVTAPNLIILLLTKKWIFAVPYLQILGLSYLFQPINLANLQTIKALGRSDIYLKLEIINRVHGIVILLVSIVCFDDPIIVAIGFLVSMYITVVVNMFPNRKLIEYSQLEQVKDFFPHLMLSTVMGIGVFLIGQIPLTNGILFVLQVFVGVVIYIGMAFVFKLETAYYLFDLLKTFLKKS